MELARLVFEVVNYAPDMVVVYNGGNDINLPLGWDPRPGYPFNFLLYGNHPLHQEDYPTFSLAAYGSHILRIVGRSYFKEHFSQRDTLRQEVQWNTNPWRGKLRPFTPAIWR